MVFESLYCCLLFVTQEGRGNDTTSCILNEIICLCPWDMWQIRKRSNRNVFNFFFHITFPKRYKTFQSERNFLACFSTLSSFSWVVHFSVDSQSCLRQPSTSWSLSCQLITVSTCLRNMSITFTIHCPYIIIPQKSNVDTDGNWRQEPNTSHHNTILWVCELDWLLTMGRQLRVW